MSEKRFVSFPSGGAKFSLENVSIHLDKEEYIKFLEQYDKVKKEKLENCQCVLVISGGLEDGGTEILPLIIKPYLWGNME